MRIQKKGFITVVRLTLLRSQCFIASSFVATLLKTFLEHLHCNLDSIGKLPSINNPRCSRPGPDRVIAGKGKELRHVQQPPKLELHVTADLSEQGHKQLQQIYND
ncbi:hypothetical protein SLE2022_184710 [Rubroshorea leprosula]